MKNLGKKTFISTENFLTNHLWQTRKCPSFLTPKMSIPSSLGSVKGYFIWQKRLDYRPDNRGITLSYLGGFNLPNRILKSKIIPSAGTRKPNRSDYWNVSSTLANLAGHRDWPHNNQQRNRNLGLTAARNWMEPG